MRGDRRGAVAGRVGARAESRVAGRADAVGPHRVAEPEVGPPSPGGTSNRENGVTVTGVEVFEPTR